MNWVPKLLSLMLLWASLAYIIVYIDPALVRDVGIEGMYLPFVGLLFVAIWYTLLLMIKSLRYSLLLTVTIVLGVVLSMMGLMFWGLGLVLVLTLGIESWYMYKSYEKNQASHESKDRRTGI